MPPAVAITRIPVRPIAEYVLKVASRCNLACDHCYVYGDSDRGWLRRPRVMDPVTVRAAAIRIAEHAACHGLDRVTVILHGGEPLLVGDATLRRILAQLRSVIDPVTQLTVHLQSNGVRLTPSVCELLADHDVKVGISLDGDRLANDRHRRFADGAGSHDHVLRALELLRTPPYRAVYGGILCTIDIENDPVGVYEALLHEEPPRIDFLLPHATWDDPPPRPGGLPTAYADWLLTIYDRWTADGRGVPIRIFDSVLSLEWGAGSGTEAIGPGASATAVIETDGSWEQVDSLKTVSADAPLTGLDVRLHAVDEVATYAGVVERQAGELSRTCQNCSVVDTCGGGLFAHRYGRGNGFANPSVYCSDLLHLIAGVRNRQRRSRPWRTRQRMVARSQLPPEQVGPPSGLPDVVLRDLAGGSPTDTTLGYLTAMEYALARALMARVAAGMTHGAGRSAWELLAELDERSPAAVRSVLSHPFVRVRARRSMTTARSTGSDARAGLLASVAVATAVRAGIAASLDVPVWRGALCLPGIGTMSLDGAGRAAVVVASHPGEFVVHPDHGPARAVSGTGSAVEGWHPVRTVPLDSAQIQLDDADPDRDCFAHPVTATLSATAADEWRDAVVHAWTLVRAEAPDLANGMDALIRTVTPIRPRPYRPARATTTRHAFGAVALSRAAPPFLASLLVEQVARITVAAVQDVCDLTDPEPPSLADLWPGDVGRAGVARLADVFARAAVLELAVARIQAGWPVDRGTSVVARRDALSDALEVLDRGRGWSASGRLLLAGLRGRVEGWGRLDASC